MASKFWTERGLKDLGKLIKDSRVNRGLTLREMADLITETTEGEVTFTALGKIENGAVMPQYNTLAAIAAAGFVFDKSGNQLTILDFIKIASQESTESLDNQLSVSSKNYGMDKLRQLILNHLDANNIDLNEFARRSLLEPSELRAIIAGQSVDEGVLLLLASSLKNPQTGQTFAGLSELFMYCEIKGLAPNSELDAESNNHANGIH